MSEDGTGEYDELVKINLSMVQETTRDYLIKYNLVENDGDMYSKWLEVENINPVANTHYRESEYYIEFPNSHYRAPKNKPRESSSYLEYTVRIDRFTTYNFHERVLITSNRAMVNQMIDEL